MLRNRGRAAGHRPAAADRYHRGRGETGASSTDPNRRVDTGRPAASGQGAVLSSRQDRAPGARLRVSKGATRNFAPPKYRAPAVRIWRRAHRLVAWFGAVAAVLILVAAAGLWRLTQGPIDLDQLTPIVQQAFDRSFGGVKIAISGGHFGVDPGSQALNLWLEGVRLSRDDGEPVATLPVVAASFSLSALLRGKMAPTRLVVQRPVLRFVRDENGKFRLGLGEVDTEPASVSDLDQLAGPERPDQPFGLMRRMTVRDATLVLDDRQTGRRWQADRVDATAERTSEGLAGDLSMAVAVAERRPEFHAAYRYSRSDGKLDLVAEIGAVEPAKLASLAPELQALEMAQFPVSGSVATRLDLASGSTEGVRIDLRFGKGSIKSDLLPEGQLTLEQGSLHAVYAPESSQLRLAKLELDLG